MAIIYKPGLTAEGVRQIAHAGNGGALDTPVTPGKEPAPYTPLSDDGVQALRALQQWKIDEPEAAQKRDEAVRAVRVVFKMPIQDGGREYYSTVTFGLTRVIREFLQAKPEIVKAAPDSAFSLDVLEAELKRAQPDIFGDAARAVELADQGRATHAAPETNGTVTHVAPPTEEPEPQKHLSDEALTKFEYLIRLPATLTKFKTLQSAFVALYDNAMEGYVANRSLNQDLKTNDGCVRLAMWELNNLMQRTGDLDVTRRREVESAISVLSLALATDFPEAYDRTPLKSTISSHAIS